MQKKVTSVLIFLLFLTNIFGIETNKRKLLNTNNDFLLHESGSSPTQNTEKSVTPSMNRNQGGLRDYVAQYPPLKPPHTTPQTINMNLSSEKQNPPTSSSKRDYVAEPFPPLKPAGSKVKDLINFYDKPNPINGGTNVPNYGSVTKLNFPTTPKPFSFSAIVSGSNKPTERTTVKSTTNNITPKPSSSSVSLTPTSPKTPGPAKLPSTMYKNQNNGGYNSNTTSDTQLQSISEELLRKDVNNAAKFLTINYQQKTTSQSKDDKSPLPLLVISPDAWNIPTVQKFIPLLDNYERDTLVNEYVTPQERNEENAFMDAIMSTTVIRHLMNFLKDKGYVTPDPKQQRDFLKQLWFSLYSRGQGKISSSAFEHVFVSELKNGEISGLHNWIYFSREEAANRVNYLGYLKYVQLNDKGAVLKLHFNQQGVDKPVDSLFIGTSPELEIALYTLCFLTRVDNDCLLKLANKDVNIITHKFRYRSKNLIGSAYPQI